MSTPAIPPPVPLPGPSPHSSSCPVKANQAKKLSDRMKKLSDRISTVAKACFAKAKIALQVAEEVLDCTLELVDIVDGIRKVVLIAGHVVPTEIKVVIIALNTLLIGFIPFVIKNIYRLVVQIIEEIREREKSSDLAEQCYTLFVLSTLLIVLVEIAENALKGLEERGQVWLESIFNYESLAESIQNLDKALPFLGFIFRLKLVIEIRDTYRGICAIRKFKAIHKITNNDGKIETIRKVMERHKKDFLKVSESDEEGFTSLMAADENIIRAFYETYRDRVKLERSTRVLSKRRDFFLTASSALERPMEKDEYDGILKSIEGNLEKTMALYGMMMCRTRIHTVNQAIGAIVNIVKIIGSIASLCGAPVLVPVIVGLFALSTHFGKYLARKFSLRRLNEHERLYRGILEKMPDLPGEVTIHEKPGEVAIIEDYCGNERVDEGKVKDESVKRPLLLKNIALIGEEDRKKLKLLSLLPTSASAA